MNMNLSLKYRPMTYNDVVNQKHIVDILKNQLKDGNSMNNYLFFGPRGTGKTTNARLTARAINCLNLQDGSPCNVCNNCKSILDGKTIDFVEIDAASHTQVEKIRNEIIEKALYTPTMLKKKIYIIDEVHMLSTSSFNALLKIMEEPPEYLVFILATTEINKVPETIVSRSLVFNFKKLTNDELVGRLEHICKNEGFKYTNQALYLIAKVCDGAMRDAIKYLEQVSVMGEISQTNVSQFLGVAPDKLIQEMIEKFKNGKFEDLIDFFESIEKSGIDFIIFSKQVLMYIDEFFMQEVEFYSKLVDLFKNILYNIKSFPVPLIIVKTQLYNYFSTNKENFKIDAKSKIKTKTILNENKEIEQKIENEIEKEVKEDKIPQKENETNEINLDELLKKIIEINDKSILNVALKNYTTIESIKDSNILLIVINSMHYNLMKKELKFLEELFNNVLGNSFKVDLKYISKEDYLKNNIN